MARAQMGSAGAARPAGDCVPALAGAAAPSHAAAIML